MFNLGFVLKMKKVGLTTELRALYHGLSMYAREARDVSAKLLKRLCNDLRISKKNAFCDDTLNEAEVKNLYS